MIPNINKCDYLSFLQQGGTNVLFLSNINTVLLNKQNCKKLFKNVNKQGIYNLLILHRDYLGDKVHDIIEHPRNKQSHNNGVI